MKASTAAVLAYLTSRGADGASEAEIQAATAIRSGAQRVHEIKAAGYPVTRVMERSAAGAVYARWIILQPTPFRAVTGEQQGLAL